VPKVIQQEVEEEEEKDHQAGGLLVVSNQVEVEKEVLEVLEE
jgi:hypothetical protein